MEPVKTCATCRHSVVGRRDPMDWWKRRLCAHPGLVDRVEGRPMYEAVEARGKDGQCGVAGSLWEAVPAAKIQIKELWRPPVMSEKTKAFRQEIGLDPVDAAVEAAHRATVEHDLPQSFNHQATMKGARLKLERDEAFTIDPGMLPRKPAKRTRRRGDA